MDLLSESKLSVTVLRIIGPFDSWVCLLILVIILTKIVDLQRGAFV